MDPSSFILSKIKSSFGALIFNVLHMLCTSKNVAGASDSIRQLLSNLSACFSVLIFLRGIFNFEPIAHNAQSFAHRHVKFGNVVFFWLVL